VTQDPARRMVVIHDEVMILCNSFDASERCLSQAGFRSAQSFSIKLENVRGLSNDVVARKVPIVPL
jgi:hypothetical protein